MTTHLIRARSAKPGLLLTHTRRDGNGAEVAAEPLRVNAVYEFTDRVGTPHVLLVFAPGETWPRDWCLPVSPGHLLDVLGPRPRRRRAVKP